MLPTKTPEIVRGGSATRAAPAAVNSKDGRDPLDGCIFRTYTYSDGIARRLRACTGFQWDAGNADKNWIRHRVSRSEAEEVFFNQPLVVADDDEHSETEGRFYVLGRTNGGRLLFLVFTIRRRLIRVISARDMTKREREVYRAHG